MSNLLFIRYKKVVSIPEGGEQGTNKHYRVLSHLLGENNITTYNIHDEITKRNIFQKIIIFIHFIQGYYYGLNKKKVNEIAVLAKSFDYVFIDRSVFGIIAKQLKKEKYKGKIITFFHNVEKIYFSVKIPRFAPWRPFVLKTIDMNDKASVMYSDITLAVTQRDADILNTLYNKKIDYILPVTFNDRLEKDSDNNISPFSTPPTCMFLGAYFPANVDGIRWFLKEVYPYVDVRMQIVGKGMSKMQDEIKGTNVELYSDVPDLMHFIENADFMIFPIFKGSGMKVKVCEALMYGKNIIATDEAFAGYDIDTEKTGALCNTKEEFIKAIQGLSQKTEMKKFNEYSRQIFLEKYSDNAAIEILRKAL